ncbi:Para-aminobenzoate synthase glutamine amidotransferase component II [Piscirickettsia salmonis]|uniref:anthranilate synthase component II n=1 Tax=Piscirickettsia salmonis TaxID=1238 RepID=UPI0012BB0CE9|nr:aminodeoxychorismate/anthranilate synthase component II [Piscirickettsia salmonis]QGP56500.1 Para-aminobenzoate synthase glutamine amidotransferase component II [Piscirickettsia salmonis]QGP61298.1 Para-aminobenzoate synthase glutamine amidotransferase component II [Piscirickettsia salmonis]QGP66064.1 Para-aminobenzoate synthase glutamine amidotransferase component II [Piscirickettsia salmonis]
MILLIDNYDSFTFNLYQQLIELDQDVKIVKNDEVTASEVIALAPQAIIISPGPGRPDDAGNCLEIVRECSKTIPILGVCLGHQVIANAFGGDIVSSDEIIHGKDDYIYHDRSMLFSGLKLPFPAARYHSLIVDKESIRESFNIHGEVADETVMAISHKNLPLYGVQFHPESILTPNGQNIIKNFLNAAVELH